MNKFLLGVLVTIIAIVGGLSYLGVMPVLSGYFAKQVYLGAKVDPQFVDAFKSKYETPDAEGKIRLDANLTGDNVTSIFARWEEKDKFFPLHSVQIRFNPDGTGEASGFLRIATAISLAKNLGYSDADIEVGKKYVQYVAGDLPFYVKGTGDMINNVLSINPTTFQIGRVTVPDSITNLAAGAVEDMALRRINQIGGADIKEASFKDGKLKFVGTIPANIKY